MLSGKDTSMSKTPSGTNRPADVASNAVHIMRIATGQIAEAPSPEDSRNPAAVALGKMGGEARAKALSKRKMKSIAKAAAESRWRKRRKKA